MRRLLTSVTIAGLVCGITPLFPLCPARAADVHSSASGMEPMRLTTTETLVGAWTGRWQAADGAADGSLGLVLTRVPGRDTIVGQFTFITGAISRTMRYEGRLDNGAVRFTLVDDGHIVLEADRDAQRPMTADRLSGRWVDRRGALPTRILTAAGRFGPSGSTTTPPPFSPRSSPDRVAAARAVSARARCRRTTRCRLTPSLHTRVYRGVACGGWQRPAITPHLTRPPGRRQQWSGGATITAFTDGIVEYGSSYASRPRAPAATLKTELAKRVAQKIAGAISDNRCVSRYGLCRPSRTVRVVAHAARRSSAVTERSWIMASGCRGDDNLTPPPPPNALGEVSNRPKSAARRLPARRGRCRAGVV